MADGSVIFSTGLDTGGLSKALGGIGSVAKGAGKTFVAGFKGVSVALGAVTTGLGFLAKTAVSYNNSMEQYTTNFGVMLGDEAAAVEHVAELREMAAKTPFGMAELADASQTMLSFGLDVETTKTAMSQLGDISLGNKERFGQLSLAFAQVSSAGKLTGQDLLQMVNAGFNPLQTIAEKTGTNLGDLKEVMAGKKGSKEFQKQLKAARKEVKKMGENASEGAKMLVQLGEDGYISAEMVGKAMEIETSEGGRFYNGMQKAAETFSGMVSTIQDDATNLLGKVFEPLTQNMKKTMLPLAQRYLGALSAAFDNSGTEGLATALGTVLGDAVTRVSNSLPDVLTLASNLLTSIATGLTDNADKIATGIAGAISAIAGSDLTETAVVSIGTLAGSLMTKLSESLGTDAGKIIGGIASGINELIAGGLVGDLVTSAFNLATGLLNGISDSLPELIPSLATGLVDGIATAVTNLPGLATAAGNILDGLKKGLFGEGGTGGAIDVLGQSIVDSINGFLSIFDGTSISFKIPAFEEIRAECQKLLDAIVEFFTVKVTVLPPGSEPGSSQSETDVAMQNASMDDTAYLWGPPDFSNMGETKGAKAYGASVAAEVGSGFDEGIAAVEEKASQLGERIAKKVSEGRTRPGRPEEGGEQNALAQQILSDLSTGLEQNSTILNGAVDSALSKAKSAADTSQFSSVGAQIAGGIARGISNGTSVVAAAARRLVQAALDAAEAAAEIHSPSRLFANRIGQPIAAGTAVGVESNAYLLRRAVTDMIGGSIPDVRGVASSIMAGSYGAGGAYAAGATNNQTNNFYVPVQTPDEFAKTMRMYATYGF